MISYKKVVNLLMLKTKNFEINGDVIIEMFTKEFSDYDEMISVLKK